MKQFFVKNIFSFLEVDDLITEITSNQIKILNSLENLQDSQIDNINLLDKNITQQADSNFKHIIYYTIGTVLIIGIIYYFTSGGGNEEAIKNIYSTIYHEIFQKIDTNNIIVDNNMKYTFDTIINNNNHLIDVINNLFIQNNEQINKILSIRLFNAILKNGRHLEDITKILENSNLITKTEDVMTSNLKKVIFADES